LKYSHKAAAFTIDMNGFFDEYGDIYRCGAEGFDGLEGFDGFDGLMV